jgi:hypothetical protein
LRKITALFLLTALVALGAGCGDDDDSGSAGDNVLHFTEDDYSYAIDGEADAGTVTFDVENVGDELHMLGVCALKDGKGVADVKKAAGAEDEAAFGEVCKEDEAIDGLGGGGVPGIEYAVTATDIKAGKYVAICFIPDKEGTPHFNLGMIKEFEIGDGEEGAAIEGDVTYTASDEKLSGPKELDAGETTIKFVPGGEYDEFLLLKIKDGKTTDDVQTFFDKMDEGGFYTDAESPVDYLYFAFDDAKPRSFTVDLTPGNWAITATNSDAEDEEQLDPDDDPHVIKFTVS